MGEVVLSLVLRDVYKDSIELMRMSTHVEKNVPGVRVCSVMVATPANLALLADLGFVGLGSLGAKSSDLVAAIKAENERAARAGLDLAAALARGQSNISAGGATGSSAEDLPRSIEEVISTGAVRLHPDAWRNWALVSVPGEFAAAEARKALRAGLNVFLFSDNISVESEVSLKKNALERGLFVAGPDCGTMLLHGIPLGFANAVGAGRVGLVGASGTGLQEVGCLIERLGAGCSALIGTGGRDLKDEVGGVMVKRGVEILTADPNTETIVVVAKKAPSAAVQAKLLPTLQAAAKTKRVVVCYLGIDASKALGASPQIQFAATLEDAAFLAVKGKVPVASVPLAAAPPRLSARIPASTTKCYGLFSGGTFAYETETLVGQAASSWTLIDFGDDEYTVGKPHPMIDYTTRCDYLVRTVGRDLTARVVLMDVVLGWGSHPDPASELAPALKQLAASPRAALGALPVVLSIVSANDDPQRASEQAQRLQAAYPDLIIAPSNAQATRLAAQLASGGATLALTRFYPSTSPQAAAPSKPTSSSVPLHVVNVGLPSFAESAASSGAKVASLQWRPPAAGDAKLGEAVALSLFDARIAAANEEAVERLHKSTSMLKGVVTEGAQAALRNLPSGKWLLHAGPPVRGGWKGLCNPMRGAMIGAMLFEGWARTAEEAEALGASGEVTLSPCHEHGAVGPMAGVISPSMPVFRVDNDAFGVTAYSTINEGLGKVLRFGAHSPEVLDRLKWMRDELAPALDKAIGRAGGVDLKALTQQALLMGDEAHNRNVASTSLFTRKLAPSLAAGSSAVKVLEFLGANDHFFLNLSMASCKAALDAAHNVPNSSLVTAMARNGVDFGVRLSGTGSTWFTDAAPQVQGLYFPGYSEKDANPDLGDSSITETFGVGAFAMAAAPAISLFVGGDAAAARKATLEMDRLTISRHRSFQIANLDFRGPALGIDARLVADRSIAPLINTGIAHRQAGVGQVGAGIARAPIQPFALGVAALRRLLK